MQKRLAAIVAAARLGVLVLTLAWATGPAAASSFETVLSCPLDVFVSSTLVVDVTLLNDECGPSATARDVRLVTGFSGNAAGTVEGIGVYGPVVALQQVSVPPATDNLPGTCDQLDNVCDGSGGTIFCFDDLDCICRDTTPGTVNTQLNAPPAVPSALTDTVATYFLLAEWEGSEQIDIETCNVAVPEPGIHLQLLAGVTALLALARRRAVRS